VLTKLSTLLKTFTFRLALVYVGLFSLSVIVLFAFIYGFAMNYVEGQIRDSIRTQYAYLLDEYQATGSSGAVARIKEMIASDDDGTGIYVLVNQKGEKLSGNLVALPIDTTQEGVFEKDGTWIKFHISDARGSAEGIEVSAIVKPLSKWRTVLIGQTMQAKTQLERTIVQAFWASLVLTVIMAFFGAVVMTQSVMRRINIINRSAGTIMSGHLSVRIPYAAGGDEFDELSFNLNRMLDRIETLLQSLSEFASNIAHDLRSPLTRIINRMDAGLRGIAHDDPSYKLLEKNITDLQGLVATFNSILKISELEANTEFRQFEPCNVRALIDSLVELYEPYASEKNVKLVNAIEHPILVQGEKNLLTQAFANLIDNAIKFTPAGGHVAIIGEEKNGRVEIVVADDGPGIPEEFRDKVFEKFFRLEQSRNTKGNGLGLSLVAAVARIHSATVTLSDNHPGLQVILSFPLSNNA
jgi:signal transduction histidine kinase